MTSGAKIDRQKIVDLMTQPIDSYVQAKNISEQIDQLLGVRNEAMDKGQSSVAIAQGEKPAQTWSQLSSQIWQTPYQEFVEIFKFLKPKPNEFWIDLGAGFGRLGVVLGLLYPESDFTGFELVDSRVDQGNHIFSNLGFSRCKLLKADIAAPSFKPPSADCYFIYDYGHRESILKTLDDLRDLAMQRKITVIGRGRDTRQWIDLKHPWLGQVIEAHHTSHWSVYRSRE